MRPSEEEPAGDADAARLFAHPGVDLPTVALLLLMWGALGANLAWALATPSPSPGQLALHVVVGVLAMNLSFTIWHDGAHGNVFRARWANDVLGVLGSWPVWIPYFLIRRGHQLHHLHANDPDKDPDAWFLDGPIWTLPLRYPAGVARTKRIVKGVELPTWEAWADRAQALALLAAFAALLLVGRWDALVVCWVLPKGLAMWVHAWYVNVVPHRGLPAERFRDTRIVTARWLSPLMVLHNYHGVHHAWQTVPWHRYPRVLRAKRALLEERGAPIFDSLAAARARSDA